MILKRFSCSSFEYCSLLFTQLFYFFQIYKEGLVSLSIVHCASFYVFFSKANFLRSNLPLCSITDPCLQDACSWWSHAFVLTSDFATDHCNRPSRSKTRYSLVYNCIMVAPVRVYKNGSRGKGGEVWRGGEERGKLWQKGAVRRPCICTHECDVKCICGHVCIICHSQMLIFEYASAVVVRFWLVKRTKNLYIYISRVYSVFLTSVTRWFDLFTVLLDF